MSFKSPDQTIIVQRAQAAAVFFHELDNEAAQQCDIRVARR